MDDTLRYIYEAGVELNKIEEIDEFSMLFEADSQKVQDQMRINNEASGKSKGFLQRAINTLLGLIQNVIDSIHSFFSYSIASDENKANFKKFKEACLADPNLKDKKITYLDYSKVMKSYDEAIAEAERLEKDAANKSQEEVTATINRLTELVGGVGKAATMAVGLDALEQIMYHDQGTAEAIAGMLNHDKSVLKSIESSLGKSAADKFNKHAQVAAGNRISVMRFKVWLLRKKERNLQEVMENTTKQLKNQFSSKWGILGFASKLKGNKELQDIVQGSDETALALRNGAARAAAAFADAKKQGTAEANKTNVLNTLGIDKLATSYQNRQAEKDAIKAQKTRERTKRFWTGK